MNKKAVSALLDTLDIAILFATADGTIQQVNNAAEHMLRLSRHEMVGSSLHSDHRFTTSYPNRTRPSPRNLPANVALRTGRPSPKFTFLLTLPDGTEKQMRSWARPVLVHGESEPIGVTLFIEDVEADGSDRDDDVRARIEKLEAVFEQLAPTIGGDPTIMRPTSSDLALLTNREREVVSLLAAGLRVANIAEDLSISEHTVRNHLKGIFRNLGVSTQSELIRRLRSSDGSHAD